MSEKVTASLGDKGLLAVKHGATAHEAEMLSAAGHPGVVELVAFDEHGVDGPTLTTVMAGTQSLATAGRIDPERAAGLVAALAATVADLHDAGIVHGRIDPSHVLLGPGDRPVLCSFSGASFHGEPSSDVASLGALLTWMLDGAGPELEPIPEQRVAWSRPRRPWSGWQRRALLNLADQATADDPAQRPTARELAAALVAAVPTAHLNDTRTFEPGAVATDSPATQRPVGLMVLGGVGVLLVVLGTSMFGTAPAPPPPAGDDVAVDGGVVEVGGVRYAVGRKGDQVTVGDWDCDGRATVALLRPATGEVFVFPGWAEPGRDLTVSAAQTVAGARRLIALSERLDCPELLVETSSGQRVEVPA